MKQSLPRFTIENHDAHWFVETDQGNVDLHYKINQVLAVEQSPYQHIMLLDLAHFGPTLILDGALQSSTTYGHIYNEMIVHVPMLSHPDPQRVLIIGGGDCGAAREALKYPGATIDMVEIDEAVVRLCTQHLPAVSGGPVFAHRLRLLFEDGFAHVARTKGEYDVVIVDSSDPDGPAASLFNEGFYRNIREAMKPGGVMICMSEAPLLYSRYLRSIRQTLGGVFGVVESCWFSTFDYPGGIFSLTYASDTTQPLAAGGQLAVPTRYLNQAILDSCFALPPFIQEVLQGDSDVIRAEDFPRDNPAGNP